MTLQDNPEPSGLAAPEAPPGQGLDCVLAARRFAQALAWTRLADVTARLEASLTAAGALEDLIALERALQGAWPPAAALPRCELMWAGPAADPGGLELAAFDEAGRVLLRRRYPASFGKRGLLHG
jgi:hypothetical protein